jgi:type IVB pilus formation R64 PilN family outer membrane protein
MKHLPSLSTALAAGALALVSGCASQAYDRSKASTQETLDAMDSARHAAANVPARSKRDFYINPRSIKIADNAERLPAMFRMPAQLNVNQRASLRDVTNILSRASGLKFSFAPDVLSEAEATALYNNFKADTTLKALLDQLTAQLNMSWRYRNSGVEFFRYETRTFHLTIAPGTATYSFSMSGQSSLSSSTGGSGGSGGGSAGGSGGAGSRLSTAVSLSPWESLEGDLKTIVRQGTFNPSQSTNTVTVTATPRELGEVESYLRAANLLQNTRMVSVNVRVYQVAQNTADNYGLNWDAIYTSLSRNLDLSLNLGTKLTANAMGITLDTAGTSPWAGSSAMLSALSTQGNTSIMTEIARVGPPGRPITFTSLRQIAYLANQTVTVVANAGTVTTNQPGVVSEGTEFSVLPMVTGDMIRLDGVLRLQTVDRITEFASGQSRSQNPETSLIEMPVSLSMRSGQALLVSSAQTNTSSFDRSGVGSAASDKSWLTGGVRNSKSTVKHYVMLVSAEIVDTSAGESNTRSR